MQERHGIVNMHKLIKGMAGSCRLLAPGALKDNVGNILLDKKEKLIRWKEYIEQLFKGNRLEMPEQELAVNGEKIEIEEVMQVIQNLKNRKAIGPDELQEEVLKTLLKGEDKLTIMTQFFNKIWYMSATIDWLKSTFNDTSKKAQPERLKWLTNY